MLEEFNNQFPNFNTVLLCYSGSHLYGTNREGSDIDIRGVVIPSNEYLMSVNKSFECYEHPGEDTKLWSLKKFLKMVTDGDPQTTEMLFTPSSKIIEADKGFFEELCQAREKIVSMNIYNRLMGFSYSEMRKVRCEKVVFEKMPVDVETLRTTIVSYMRENNADKAATDDILEQFDVYRKFSVVSSTSNLGAKRKKEVEQYGYCTSSAAHSIRLLLELEELLISGQISFPRGEAGMLKDIRTGKMSLEEVEKLYDSVRLSVEEQKSKTKLRPKPDMDYVDSMYQRLLLENICKQSKNN